jgi:hypothetical protein
MANESMETAITVLLSTAVEHALVGLEKRSDPEPHVPSHAGMGKSTEFRVQRCLKGH